MQPRSHILVAMFLAASLPCQDRDPEWFFGNRNDLSNEIQRRPITAVYVYNGVGYKIAHMHFSAYLAASDP